MSATELKVTFGPVNRNNVNSLEKLNSVCLPVSYSKKFYKAVLDTPDELTKFAYVKGIPIGAICCRVEEDKDDETKRKLYIMTLVVLAPYRRRGVARKLLESVLDAISKNKEWSNIHNIYLHVQTSNATAVSFYKTFGFSVEATLKDYYKRIEPPHCYILSKSVAGN